MSSDPSVEQVVAQEARQLAERTFWAETKRGSHKPTPEWLEDLLKDGLHPGVRFKNGTCLVERLLHWASSTARYKEPAAFEAVVAPLLDVLLAHGPAQWSWEAEMSSRYTATMLDRLFKAGMSRRNAYYGLGAEFNEELADVILANEPDRTKIDWSFALGSRLPKVLPWILRNKLPILQVSDPKPNEARVNTCLLLAVLEATPPKDVEAVLDALLPAGFLFSTVELRYLMGELYRPAKVQASTWTLLSDRRALGSPEEESNLLRAVARHPSASPLLEQLWKQGVRPVGIENIDPPSAFYRDWDSVFDQVQKIDRPMFEGIGNSRELPGEVPAPSSSPVYTEISDWITSRLPRVALVDMCIAHRNDADVSPFFVTTLKNTLVAADAQPQDGAEPLVWRVAQKMARPWKGQANIAQRDARLSAPPRLTPEVVQANQELAQHLAALSLIEPVARDSAGRTLIEALIARDEEATLRMMGAWPPVAPSAPVSDREAVMKLAGEIYDKAITQSQRTARLHAAQGSRDVLLGASLYGRCVDTQELHDLDRLMFQFNDSVRHTLKGAALATLETRPDFYEDDRPLWAPPARATPAATPSSNDKGVAPGVVVIPRAVSPR